MNPLIAAAAEGAAEGGDKISPILAPYPGLVFWTILTFGIAMFILWKKAFGPIQDALDRRRQTINGALENAERLRTESEEVLRRYEERLAAARGEADAIIERSRTAGDEISARLKSEAEQYKQEQMAQTQAQVRAEVEKAMGDLRSAVAEMTVTAAEKVLRGSLDQSQHQRLIEQAVEELDFTRLEKVGAGS